MYLPEALSDQDQRKGYRALLADAENAGAAEFAVYQRGGPVQSQELASFSGSWRKFLLRRVLLALRVPPQWLAYLARLVAHPGRRLAWVGFVQTYCYWRGVQRAAGSGSAWRQLTQGVPILMYHALGQPGEKPGRYIMPATRFASQMAWLRRLGYRVISLDEYADCRHSRRLPPPRSVVLTLDDGYADSRGLAAPILTHYRFPATVFLVSGRLGSANRWDHHGELAGRHILSRSDAAELSSAGIRVGAHTRSHPSLLSLSPEEAWDEIDGARRDLEALLGVPVTCFAYPYGEYNAGLQAFAERSGFRLACTADGGLNTLPTPLHALRRAEIYGTDGWLRFLLALWFGDAAAIFPRRRDGTKVSPSSAPSPAGLSGSKAPHDPAARV
jgi:peptidoglycan/xylan/chitin deacetylase (PgdA/CDA1 family)